MCSFLQVHYNSIVPKQDMAEVKKKMSLVERGKQAIRRLGSAGKGRPPHPHTGR